MLDNEILHRLRTGCVIPAHPLALDAEGGIDIRHQRALTRYYLSAGAGGLAVGVHTTQFAIHDPKIGLLKPVLELVAETTKQHVEKTNQNPPIIIAGIVGPTSQAVEEAQMAYDLGYHIGLLSLTALAGRSISELLEHARQVARVIPIMGFYLQQSISRMILPQEFWKKLVQIPNLAAIKIAPFNRYQTMDVLEAVAASGRSKEIALYTGNDDTIIQDLLTTYSFNISGQTVLLQIAGGLLGQWACWTRKAVDCFCQIKEIRKSKKSVPLELLTTAGQLTLANKAIFDANNNFTGCIPGILYVLKQQGLIREIHTLDSNERLSPGQAEKIDQIIRDYPQLTDDDFVRENLNNWLSS